MPTKTYYFEFEVSLIGVEPRIWRRFLLRNNSSFMELHDTIQKACGWLDYHLYEFREYTGKEPFERGNGIATSPFDDPFDDDEAVPVAGAVQLRDHFPLALGKKVVYEYDFGDGWLHLVELVGVKQLEGTTRRYLVDGARAFPREDCGGIGGYEECLQAFVMSESEIAELEDGGLREHLQMTKEWLGDWHPEAFDFDAAAKELKRRVNYPWLRGS